MDEQRPSEVHFSRAQRWDLARMTAAALVSTGFFAAPVMLSQRTPAPVQPASVAAPAPALPDDRVQLVTTDVVAGVSTPRLELRTPRVARAAAAPRPRPRVVRASDKLAERTFGRRVVRLLAGDGRYTVRPFPTVQSASR